MNASLTAALKRFETLITRPAESLTDPAQRITEFARRLERTRRLMDALGNPEQRFRSIHIGGTSGKGSIAMMCEAILHAAGFRVGTHTSPYLQTPLEKVRVAQSLLDASSAVALSDQVMAAVDHVRAEYPALGSPQYAEAWVGMALRHIADSACDLGVIEVGMGGRYDATNILLPDVSVISTIHYDHVRVLGDTLAEIAHHKAGIIKPGVPVVAGNLLPEAREVIEAEAVRIGARLIRVGRDVHFITHSLDRGRGFFDYEGLHLNLSEVEVGLTGPHQVENAATAVAAVEVLAETLRQPITEDAVRRGLAAARYAGRVEIMQQSPTVILDGAHNEEKINALVETIRQIFVYDRLILVLGLLEAKSALPIVAKLSTTADEIITTAPTVKGKPAIPADQLAEVARTAGAQQVRVSSSPLAALHDALATATPTDLVIVTGSLYLIGELRSHWYNTDAIIDQRTMFPKNSQNSPF